MLNAEDIMPIRTKVDSSIAFLKLSWETFFFLNPPCLGPGDVYQPSVTITLSHKKSFFLRSNPHRA